jgi:hypothetical protein
MKNKKNFISRLSESSASQSAAASSLSTNKLPHVKIENISEEFSARNSFTKNALILPQQNKSNVNEQEVSKSKPKLISSLVTSDTTKTPVKSINEPLSINCQQPKKKIRKIKDAFPSDSSSPFNFIQAVNSSSLIILAPRLKLPIMLTEEPRKDEIESTLKNNACSKYSSSKIKDLLPISPPSPPLPQLPSSPPPLPQKLLMVTEDLNPEDLKNPEKGVLKKIYKYNKAKRILKAKTSNKIKDILLSNAHTFKASSSEETENKQPATTTNNTFATTNYLRSPNRSKGRQVLKINTLFSNQSEREEEESDSFEDSIKAASPKSNETPKTKRMNSKQIKNLLKSDLFIVKAAAKKKNIYEKNKINNLLNLNLEFANSRT